MKTAHLAQVAIPSFWKGSLLQRITLSLNQMDQADEVIDEETDLTFQDFDILSEFQEITSQHKEEIMVEWITSILKTKQKKGEETKDAPASFFEEPQLKSEVERSWSGPNQWPLLGHQARVVMDAKSVSLTVLET